MPLYNPKVIKAIDADKSALSYKAKDIKSDLSGDNLKAFESSQRNNKKTSFRMDPILAEMTGHAAIQDEKIKTEVEKLALEKLKEIEEVAYKEAYDLGMVEGTEQGVREVKAEIEEKIFQLEKQTEYLASLLPKLLEANEAKLIEMIFKIASKIALQQIQIDESYIIELIKNLSTGIQSDLETILHVSAEDHKFITDMGEKFKREVRLPKNAIIQADNNLKHGECVIETNYGVVDATIDARLEKLWSILKESIPKTYSEGA